MAHLGLDRFPSRIPAGIEIIPNDGIVPIPRPQGLPPLDIYSRGVSVWTGLITWPTALWWHDIGGGGGQDEVQAFVDAMEGGLNTFDIPLNLLHKGRPHRFPNRSESTNANSDSVHVLSVEPLSGQTPQAGLASTLVLDNDAGPGVGLRIGDWVTLVADSSVDEAGYTPDQNFGRPWYRGAYRCFTNQVGDRVSVRNAAPQLTGGSASDRHRLITREPFLRARMSGQAPGVSYDGAWNRPLTIRWSQAW